MKKTIRPFELGSLMLLITGLAFPIITIYFIVRLFIMPVDAAAVIYVVIGAVLTYCYSTGALRIVFTSRFDFYDTYCEVTYFDGLVEYYSSDMRNVFKVISPKKCRLEYEEIEKFASVEGRWIFKDESDDYNHIYVKAKINGDTYRFTVPQKFYSPGNYFLFNYKNLASYMINGKMYSVSQVKKVLDEFQNRTKIKPCGGYPATQSLIPALIIVLALAGPIIIFLLLESK
ncbi:MAG: hypothetical protein MJ230_08160 [bacterium]|nr:hypothetical protein [bacterium]